MSEPLSDADVAAIEERAVKALDVAPAPWTTWLETRAAEAKRLRSLTA